MIVLVYPYNIITLGECLRDGFRKMGGVDVVSVGPADKSGSCGHLVETEAPYVPWSVIQDLERQRGPIEAVIQVESGALCLLRDVPRTTPFPIAFYSADASLHVAASVRFARLFDHVFCAYPDEVNLLRNATRGPATCLPFGGLTDLELPAHAPKEYDIVFVGHRDARKWPRRAALLDRLTQRYRCLVTQAPREQTPALLAQGHLAFNCSINGRSNMRVFEAMSYGACLLTDRVHDGVLEANFREGIHYAGYDDDSLEQVIDGYLADPERCQRIGRAAREEILARHTWAHRAAAMRETLLARRAQQDVFRRRTLRWGLANAELTARRVRYRLGV